MVWNSPLVVSVANVSANVCQYIACNPERLSSEQVLDLIFCFPFRQLRRVALSLWTLFCYPPSPYDSSSSSSSDISGSSSSSGYDDSHSD